MGLQQLWVAMVSLASTSANRFTAGDPGLKFGLSQNEHNISEVLLAKYDMDGSLYNAMGVLPHPFHTPMDLQQLCVAVVSLAST